MHKIIYFFSREFFLKKCLPYLNSQTSYPKHTYIFIWPNTHILSDESGDHIGDGVLEVRTVECIFVANIIFAMLTKIHCTFLAILD